MPQINFLRLQQEKLKQKVQRLFIIQTLALASLIIYFLIVAATFAYYFVIGKEAKLLEEKIAAARKRVEVAVGVETKQVYLKSKAQNLSSILESAKSHQTIVKGIFAILPEGIEINNFEVSDKGEINLSGKAIDFSVLGTLLGNIQKRPNQNDLPIYAAQVNKIFLSEKGELSFDLTLFLSKATSL